MSTKLSTIAANASTCASRSAMLPILLAVGWYLRFSLSYRDVEEWLAERGLRADHVTVWRWVQRYAPEWFVAAQSGLSYIIAGTSKLSSTAWRDGTALTGIFSTDIYGCQPIYKLLVRHPAISRFAAWSFECSFVGLCLLGPRCAVLAIALGVLFHLGTAVSMGLNTFLASFIAAYPAVWFVVT